MRTFVDTLVASVVGETFVEWRRVFPSATDPVLVPLYVVPIPEEILAPKPVMVYFASDADWKEISLWNRSFSLPNYELEITFNGEAQGHLGKIPLTGFTVIYRRRFVKDTTPYIEPLESEVEEC
jgi:hypothetical protein